MPTWYTPVADDVHDRDTLAEVVDEESVTLTYVVWLRPVQEIPCGTLLRRRLTVPVNPFRAVTVTEVVPVVPVLTVVEAGLAETLKSVTTTVSVTEWDSDPLVPVSVTV